MSLSAVRRVSHHDLNRASVLCPHEAAALPGAPSCSPHASGVCCPWICRGPQGPVWASRPPRGPVGSWGTLRRRGLWEAGAHWRLVLRALRPSRLGPSRLRGRAEQASLVATQSTMLGCPPRPIAAGRVGQGLRPEPTRTSLSRRVTVTAVAGPGMRPSSCGRLVSNREQDSLFWAVCVL